LVSGMGFLLRSEHCVGVGGGLGPANGLTAPSVPVDHEFSAGGGRGFVARKKENRVRDLVDVARLAHARQSDFEPRNALSRPSSLTLLWFWGQTRR
jgi:hypothetical protein